MALSVHTIAPDFSLPSTSGASFQLSVTQKNKPCIIYFYPKDFTGGCTKEACEFRDQFAEFRGLDIDIYGVSRDGIETHLKFKETYKLPFDLLSDVDGEVAKLYEARIPVIGLTKRITYLLDSKHQIASVYQDMFGAENHIKTMIEKIKS